MSGKLALEQGCLTLISTVRSVSGKAALVMGCQTLVATLRVSRVDEGIGNGEGKHLIRVPLTIGIVGDGRSKASGLLPSSCLGSLPKCIGM